jgi:hypothetical protein
LETTGNLELLGHVENGVIVLEGGATLPEGALVRVVYGGSPGSRVAPCGEPVPLPGPGEPAGPKQRLQFPLVTTGEPGSLHLTNEQIHAILEREDIEALKGNVPS